jgi:hypothetical protein
MSRAWWILGTLRSVAAGGGLLALPYAAYVGIAWFRYGRAEPDAGDTSRDPLVDRFIPEYEVAERHQIRYEALRMVEAEAERRARMAASPAMRR